MLDSLLRIEIADKRVFIGKLLAMDKSKNIVLGNSIEYSQDTKVLVRKTGMVMISGKDIVTVWKTDL